MYGLMILTGAAAGIGVALLRAKKYHQQREMCIRDSHNGGPVRHTDGAVRVTADKRGPLVSEPVEMRGKNVGISQSRNGIEPLLVGGNQKDIGPVHSMMLLSKQRKNRLSFFGF